jgi:hypothetical protein
MKFIALTLSMLCAAPYAEAGSFTLVDNATKLTYTCTPGHHSDHPSDDGSTDCVPRLQAVCVIEFGSGCFNSAVNSCKGKSRQYARCVEKTFESCRKEYGSGCYDSARNNCK